MANPAIEALRRLIFRQPEPQDIELPQERRRDPRLGPAPMSLEEVGRTLKRSFGSARELQKRYPGK